MWHMRRCRTHHRAGQGSKRPAGIHQAVNVLQNWSPSLLDRHHLMSTSSQVHTRVPTEPSNTPTGHNVLIVPPRPLPSFDCSKLTPAAVSTVLLISTVRHEPASDISNLHPLRLSHQIHEDSPRRAIDVHNGRLDACGLHVSLSYPTAESNSIAWVLLGIQVE